MFLHSNSLVPSFVYRIINGRFLEGGTEGKGAFYELSLKLFPREVSHEGKGKQDYCSLSAEAKHNLRRVHSKGNDAEIVPRACEHPKLETLREMWCLKHNRTGSTLCPLGIRNY